MVPVQRLHASSRTGLRSKAPRRSWRDQSGAIRDLREARGGVVKIFVAGGTGVIGRRVIPLLRSAGHEVTALSRSVDSDARLERLGARPVRGNIFSLPDFAADVVINLATSIPPASRTFLPGAWSKTTKIRRTGSANLSQAAAVRGVKRLIQESFAPVYPDAGDRWIDETSPLVPVRYNRAVVDAERNAQAFPGTWIVL